LLGAGIATAAAELIGVANEPVILAASPVETTDEDRAAAAEFESTGWAEAVDTA